MIIKKTRSLRVQKFYISGKHLTMIYVSYLGKIFLIDKNIVFWGVWTIS